MPVTPAALGSAFHLAGSDSACQPQRGPTEGRRRLINVSAELRLYRSSGRMAPFISAPSAQAHVLLPRQPTRTPRVCSSPTRGCSLHEEAGGLECGSFSPAPGGQQERSWRGPAPGLEPPTASDWSLGGAREPCHAGEKERGASLVVHSFVRSFMHPPVPQTTWSTCMCRTPRAVDIRDTCRPCTHSLQVVTQTSFSQ